MGALPTDATFVGDGKRRAPKKAAEIKRSRDLDFSPKQIVQHFCGLFNFCHALLCGGECPLIPIGEQSSSSPSATGFVLGEEPAPAGTRCG